MTVTHTANLGLAQIEPGTQDGAWGDIVNDSITQLVEQAITGVTSITADANVELTRVQGAIDQSRSPIIVLSGVRTANRQLILPYRGGQYVIINATSGDPDAFVIEVRTQVGAGTEPSDVVLPGESRLLVGNGVQYIRAMAQDPEAMRGENNLSETEDAVAAQANIGLAASTLELVRAFDGDSYMTPGSAAAAMAPVEVATSNNYTPNWATFTQLYLTVGDDIELLAPVGMGNRATRVIFLLGDSEVARTVSFAANYANAPEITDLTDSYGYFIVCMPVTPEWCITSAQGVGIPDLS